MAIYNGKHCVFEEEKCEYPASWNSSTNVDDNGASNNWNISSARNSVLPAILLKLSSDLQNNLTNTTIQTAKNGLYGDLVSTSDKLFIAAEKEMWTNPNFSRNDENMALTTWSYRTTHTQMADHIKYENSATQYYWLRSPVSGVINKTVYVYNDGTAQQATTGGMCRFSPCFAF